LLRWLLSALSLLALLVLLLRRLLGALLLLRRLLGALSLLALLPLLLRRPILLFFGLILLLIVLVGLSVIRSNRCEKQEYWHGAAEDEFHKKLPTCCPCT
jgi:hypothetical protein